MDYIIIYQFLSFFFGLFFRYLSLYELTRNFFKRLRGGNYVHFPKNSGFSLLLLLILILLLLIIIIKILKMMIMMMMCFDKKNWRNSKLEE